MAEIDHEHTRNAVCPWCGHIDRDSWELGGREDDGEAECGDCGKPYRWSRHVSVSYSTQREEARNG